MGQEEVKQVRCTGCGWAGKETSLPKEYDGIEMATMEVCPECGDKWSLVGE